MRHYTYVRGWRRKKRREEDGSERVLREKLHIEIVWKRGCGTRSGRLTLSPLNYRKLSTPPYGGVGCAHSMQKNLAMPTLNMPTSSKSASDSMVSCALSVTFVHIIRLFLSTVVWVQHTQGRRRGGGVRANPLLEGLSKILKLLASVMNRDWEYSVVHGYSVVGED